MRQKPRDTSDEALAFECDLPDPPEKVWRALSVPELRAAWLMPTGVEPMPGNCNAANERGGEPSVECDVIEADPCRLLRLSWREKDFGSDTAIDNVVTFALARTATGGTHLSIVHDAFVVAGAEQAIALAGGNVRLSLGRARAKNPPVAANAPRLLMRAA